MRRLTGPDEAVSTMYEAVVVELGKGLDGAVEEIKDEVVACGCTFSEHQDLDQVVAGVTTLRSLMASYSAASAKRSFCTRVTYSTSVDGSAAVRSLDCSTCTSRPRSASRRW